MTRSQPLAVKGAHLSIISHVTAAELRRELTEVDTVNGFANRFLFAYVERSKVLPYGGYVPEHELDQLADRLGEAIDKDWGHETIIFDAGARALWEESYPTLTEDRPGLHGAATARSEAQVIRHALDLLETLKLIRREPVPTGGRPKERIHLRSLKEIDP